MPHSMTNFHVACHTMRYSLFVPRLYNFCKSLGFEPGRIMPSRAFCSDENQGYPIILITKHFGTFPFNHGRVGGIVATGRHGPHAHHGKDLVIIQASHVGYDPKLDCWGTYRRLQMEPAEHTSSCGKISGTLQWYRDEYQFARDNIYFTRIDGIPSIVIDNQLLDCGRTEGILLRLDRLVAHDSDGKPQRLRIFSTAKGHRIHSDLLQHIDSSTLKDGQRLPMGDRLTPDLFEFRRSADSMGKEGHRHLEQNLSYAMPAILTADSPALAAAAANTQMEFDRAYRTLLTQAEYQNRNLVFIAGVNIDISPRPGQVFPLTKFVPWAAFVQNEAGVRTTLEQEELFRTLMQQSTENPDQIDLEAAIAAMEQEEEVPIEC